MSARLAPLHTHPYCTAMQTSDGAGHVQVYDLHTRELVAVHEVQPDQDALRAELRRTKARLIERTALVYACAGLCRDLRAALDTPSPDDRVLVAQIDALLRRIETEVAR